jgi:hypothetical protein
LVGGLLLGGCGQEEDVATLSTGESAVSSVTPTQQDLDQYGRAQALEACLVDARLPALLTPMDGGEAEIGWAEGHEVLSRDFENWTVLLDGPAGSIDPTTKEAFTNVDGDAATGTLAPSLWVDGKDYTRVWVGCLESSGYTNPTAYMEADPAEDDILQQRMVDAANEWIACAREHGLPGLADVIKDDPDRGPYGPHAEIPLETDPVLLESLMQACPMFNEEYTRRQAQGDSTVQDDVLAGRLAMNPLILVEAPDGLQSDSFDYESEDGQRYLELQDLLYAPGYAMEEEYAREQVEHDTTESPEPAE